MGWGHLKMFFSRTTRPILNRLKKNHPWEKLNKVDCPSPRGGNSKGVKLH
jgi:hypothetical protein